MARIRCRRHAPLLCVAAARGRADQDAAQSDDRGQHRLALLQRAETRAEGVTRLVAAFDDAVRRYGVYAVKSAEGSLDHTLLTSIIDARGILRVQYLGMRFDPAEFRRDLLRLAEQR